MDTDQMTKRVGDFKIIRTATMDGYRLKFNKRSKDGSGKANVVSDPQTQVEGVVFDLTDYQLKILDQYEKGYSRKAIRLTESLQAVTYIANADEIDEKLLPAKDYLDKIISGAEKHELSESYIEWLKAFAVQE